jgi:hypothetical protein
MESIYKNSARSRLGSTCVGMEILTVVTNQDKDQDFTKIESWLSILFSTVFVFSFDDKVSLLFWTVFVFSFEYKVSILFSTVFVISFDYKVSLLFSTVFVISLDYKVSILFSTVFVISFDYKVSIFFSTVFVISFDCQYFSKRFSFRSCQSWFKKLKPKSVKTWVGFGWKPNTKSQNYMTIQYVCIIIYYYVKCAWSNKIHITILNLLCLSG